MAIRSSRSKKLAQGNDLNGILFEPQSDWVPHGRFPDIRGARRIAIDSETRDPNLKARGPGSIRRDGYPVGFSIATDDGFSGYYPIAHLAGGNLAKEPVIQWLQDMLGDSRADKIGCTLLYDLEWMHTLGITVRGRLHDLQVAESLIDEENYDGYDLHSIARKYGAEGKDESLLRRAAAEFNIDPKADMWKLHSRFVGPYAEADAIQTLKTHDVQQLEILRQGLGKVYDLECELIPIILKMRIQGVRVDLEVASKLSKQWQVREDELKYKLLVEYGRDVDPWSGIELMRMCDHLKIQYPRTEKGNASFTGDFLEHSGHPFLKGIRDVRRLNRMRGTFVDELIFGNQINGRIHAQFHQLRGDEYGVRGGRFSSSNPNLQQVPARDSELAPLIRSLFIPEEGCGWTKLDYSQQEPRIAVHYAYICKLRAADVARQAWIDDPNADFYKIVVAIASIIRKDAKTVYLGRTYGMGKRKLAADLGRSEEEAEEIIRKFDEALPFLQALSEKCIKQADVRGYIKTIYGRICHFNYWLPVGSNWWAPDDDRWNGKNTPIKTEEAAKSQWPRERLCRAHTRKALNRLIQGSAGDMTKLAMRDNYREHKAVPHLQVHDELDYSSQCYEDAVKLKHGMESCVKMEVPIVAELEYLKAWK
jgi:DNA polymerase I-like protein with 3'-5' exonuclease and polymerase domains